MPVTAYLNRKMLRRVLTCFALITGLAAIGAPVNAGLVDSMSQQVGTSKPAPHAGSSEQCECRMQRGTAPGKRGNNPHCKPRKPIIIYIPTVQFGADRALE